MPIFACWDPERGDEGDGLPIRAATPAQAAEKFSAERDARDVEYPAARTVHVRDADAVEVFEVTLRSEPVYTARKRK